jgi:hypothetical protein
MLKLQPALSCCDKDRVKGDGLCAATRPLFNRRGFAFRGKIHCVPSCLVPSFCWQLSFISPFNTAVFSSSDCAVAVTAAAAATTTTTTNYLFTYLFTYSLIYLFIYLLLIYLVITCLLIYLFITCLTYLLIYYLLTCCSDVLCSIKMYSCVGYSDSLKDGRPGERISVGGEIFCTRPDRSWGRRSKSARILVHQVEDGMTGTRSCYLFLVEKRLLSQWLGDGQGCKKLRKMQAVVKVRTRC